MAANPSLERHPSLDDWLGIGADGRVRAIGHGRKTDMTSAEALAVGTKAKPTTVEHADAAEPNGLRVGERVSVAPDDYGRFPVEGTVVSSSAQHIAIRRNDPVACDVVVHFPRAGFVVTKTEQAGA